MMNIEDSKPDGGVATVQTETKLNSLPKDDNNGDDKIKTETKINNCNYKEIVMMEEDIEQEDDINLTDALSTYVVDDEHIPQKLKDLSKPILNTINESYISNFKFFNERYYEDRYFVEFSSNSKHKSNEDILVRVHTNKLLLVSLAKGNDILQSKKDISEISFIINKTDRSKIKIQGKRKLGARQLEPHTILCQVRLEGESTLRNIRAGVKGYLVEINELIKNSPNLLKTDPKGDGFIAIVMPKGPLHDTENSVKNLNLLSEDEYMKFLAER